MLYRSSKIRVSVGARVDITGAAMNNPDTDELRAALHGLAQHKNPKHAQLTRLRIRFNERAEPRVVDMSRPIKGGGISLPCGLLDGALAVLSQHGHPTTPVYLRVEGVDVPEREHLLTLRPFQVDIMATIEANPVALVRAPPGSGKTTVGLAAFAALRQRTLVIVPRTSLLEQWKERCVAELGMNPKEVGIIQGSKRTIGDITIASQQTLANCVGDYTNTFGVVMGDEAQTFAASTFIAVIDRLHSNHRIGFTADERRSDGKDFLVRWLFGKPRIEVKRDFLEDEKLLEDVQVVVVPYTRPAPDWWGGLSADQRNSPEVQRLVTDYITTDQDRTALVVRIVEREAKRGNATLALSHRVEHCHTMQQMLAQAGMGAGLLLGGAENKQEYNYTRDAIREGRQRAAIGTYQAVGVGVDLPSLSVGVCATPCANYRNSRFQWNQYRGRFARVSPGKLKAVMFYIWDEALFGDKPVGYLTDWNRNVTFENHKMGD